MVDWHSGLIPCCFWSKNPGSFWNMESVNSFVCVMKMWLLPRTLWYWCCRDFRCKASYPGLSVCLSWAWMNYKTNSLKTCCVCQHPEQQWKTEEISLFLAGFAALTKSCSYSLVRYNVGISSTMRLCCCATREKSCNFFKSKSCRWFGHGTR